MDLDDLEALTLEYLDDPFKRRWVTNSLRRLINAGMDDVKRFIEETNETYFVEQTTGANWVVDHSGTTTSNVVSTNDDVTELTLPVNFSKMIAVENVSETPPLPLYYVNFAERHPDESMNDKFLPEGFTYPDGYYLKGSSIGFVSPNTSFSVRLTYIKNLDRLSSGSHRPTGIPEDYHDLICLQAAKRGYAIEGRRLPRDLSDLRVETLKSMQGFLENRTVQSPQYVNVQE
jgi:hypothetical protein